VLLSYVEQMQIISREVEMLRNKVSNKVSSVIAALFLQEAQV
jgi:hypothetical protein